MRQPPCLATSLLSRFAVNQSVVGDLVERYQRGQSSSWYWRQALIAVFVKAGSDVQANRLLAARGIVLGCAIQWLLLFLLRAPVRRLSNLTGKWVWNWSVENGVDIVRDVWFGRSGLSMPLILTLCFVSAIAGWIVARLHRSRQSTLVTAFAVSTPTLIATWLYRESGFTHHFGGYSTLAWYATWLLIVIPLCALLGGLSGTQSGDSHYIAD